MSYKQDTNPKTIKEKINTLKAVEVSISVGGGGVLRKVKRQIKLQRKRQHFQIAINSKPLQPSLCLLL